MASTDTVKLSTVKLDRMIRLFEPRAHALVAEVAIGAAHDAQRLTIRVDTGLMKAGWRAWLVDKLTWYVGTAVPYAVYHEYGTVRFSSTPMLRPAVEVARRVLAKKAVRLFRG